VVRGTPRTARQGHGSVVPLYRAQQHSRVVQYDKTGRVCDSRYTGQGDEHGKKGGEPRIFQCPLEECEDGDWEIGDEDLEVNELMEL